MCKGCPDKIPSQKTPEELNQINIDRAAISQAILDNGGTLENRDYCPFCGRHVWYFCKRGCIVTGETL